MSGQIYDWLPEARNAGARALDLGCGRGDYRPVLENLGYRWTGIDVQTEQGMLADAHALPFADDTFDVVISLAALEHIEHPVVALREVARVLKPEGVFVGSTAFLVPFHGDASFCNFSHAGLRSVFDTAGLDLMSVSPDQRYTGIRAIAVTGMFIGLPRGLAYLLVSPLVLLFHCWWVLLRLLMPGRYSKEMKYALNTGAFSFRAVPSGRSVSSGKSV